MSGWIYISIMRQKKVLVVEDNPLNARLFKDVLLSFHCRVFIATKASEAFHILKTKTPDLILMDVQLPGVSGIELMRKIRWMPRFKHSKIIAVSAFVMTEEIRYLLFAGFDGFLPKPVDIYELKKLVSTL